MKQITIAIDGFSSTGKSTLAKQLAKKLNYSYVDTGAMYRATALFAMRNNCFENDVLDVKKLESMLSQISITFKYSVEEKANLTYLNNQNVEDLIRGIAVSNKVSEVATNSKVRRMLVEQQQEMGKNKAVVMDGRDIGTVVFPDAELKIFMTANEDIRAQRRFEELQSKGQKVSFNQVLENLSKRDTEDRNRADSPLIEAEDAKEIDNTNISEEEQFNMALGWAKDLINS